MAKALHKVQKQISRKQNGKPTNLHENSRDSRRLRTASARDEKLAKLVAAATRANQAYVERVAFFQAAVADMTGSVTEDEMQAFTAGFIAREDEHLESLEAQRRPGRPTSSQEDRLRHRKEGEQREYRSGFWVPDLRDEPSRLRLKRWNGEWAALNALTFVRIVWGGGIKPSSFPPKGLS